MTRPSRSSLVLDGNIIRLRLEAQRVHSKTPVHVDWLRFTVLRRHQPTPSVDKLFPLAENNADTWQRMQELQAHLKSLPDCDTATEAQARELAETVAQALGHDYAVPNDVRKGHDFYRFRLSIERNGVECGWVGFQASSESPRQAAQGKTLHVNLYGAACTFAAPGWTHRLANIIDQRNGEITRADLALDFFDGIKGGIERIDADYDAGRLDVFGKRLKCKHLGDWSAHTRGARSLYVGSKEAGKETNCYEKGDQLYGVEHGSDWLRVELRYGNKLRELDSDILRRPADFFAGASDWHASILREANAQFLPERVPTKGRLAAQSVQAEVVRAVRWASVVAGPTLSTLFRVATDNQFLSLVTSTKRPGRLARFSDGEISRALASLSPVEGAGPAFAQP